MNYTQNEKIEQVADTTLVIEMVVPVTVKRCKI